MSDRRVWQCDRCGFQMFRRHCKVICPNCGARWDCSDVTIWVGDARNGYTTRPYGPADQPELVRRWPDAPTAADLRNAAVVWLLWQNSHLRGYAALFPVPGLPHLFDLHGEVEASACRLGGAAQLLRALLDNVDRDLVQEVTYAVNSLDSHEARFLQHHGFRPGHEEWQMQRDLPPPEPKTPLPRGFDVRTLPHPQAQALFLQLYEACFSPTPWYQPYSPSEVAAELGHPRDLHFLFHQDQPVGFAWLHTRDDEGEIEPMGILPVYQGRGAGRALLTVALWRLAERGLQRATIGAWRQNEAAIYLYQSAGFQRVSRRFYLVCDVAADSIPRRGARGRS